MQEKSESKVLHPFLASFLRRLLLGDTSLVASFAAWSYENWSHISIQFCSVGSWTSYVYDMIKGKRPFPLPDNYTDADRVDGNEKLLLDSIAWISSFDPKRLALALVLGGVVSDRVVGVGLNGITEGMLAITEEAGHVAGEIGRSIADGKLSKGERAAIVGHIERAQLKLANLKAMVEEVR